MVLVVEDIHKVSIERVDVIQLREIGEDLGQLIVEALLGEFHLAHVKLPDSGYLVLLVNHSRSFPLGFRQDDVNEVL